MSRKDEHLDKSKVGSSSSLTSQSSQSATSTVSTISSRDQKESTEENKQGMLAGLTDKQYGEALTLIDWIKNESFSEQSLLTMFGQWYKTDLKKNLAAIVNHLCYLDERDTKRSTIFLKCVEFGSPAKIKFLIERCGANINQMDENGQVLPLMLAINKQRGEVVVNLLIDKQSSSDDPAKTPSANPYEIKQNEVKQMSGPSLMHGHGASSNVSRGNMFMFQSAASFSTVTFNAPQKSYIQQKAEELILLIVTFQSLKKMQQNFFQFIELQHRSPIINYRSQFSSDRDNSASAFMHAVEVAELEIIIYLKEQGANINLENNRGQTPLTLAGIRKRAEVVDKLKSWGAVSTASPMPLLLSPNASAAYSGVLTPNVANTALPASMNDGQTSIAKNVVIPPPPKKKEVIVPQAIVHPSIDKNKMLALGLPICLISKKFHSASPYELLMKYIKQYNPTQAENVDEYLKNIFHYKVDERTIHEAGKPQQVKYLCCKIVMTIDNHPLEFKAEAQITNKTPEDKIKKLVTKDVSRQMLKALQRIRHELIYFFIDEINPIATLQDFLQKYNLEKPTSTYEEVKCQSNGSVKTFYRGIITLVIGGKKYINSSINYFEDRKNAENRAAYCAIINLSRIFHHLISFLKMEIPSPGDGPTQELLQFLTENSTFWEYNALQGHYRTEQYKFKETTITEFQCRMVFKKTDLMIGRYEVEKDLTKEEKNLTQEEKEEKASAKRKARENGAQKVLYGLGKFYEEVKDNVIFELGKNITASLQSVPWFGNVLGAPFPLNGIPPENIWLEEPMKPQKSNQSSMWSLPVSPINNNDQTSLARGNFNFVVVMPDYDDTADVLSDEVVNNPHNDQNEIKEGREKLNAILDECAALVIGGKDLVLRVGGRSQELTSANISMRVNKNGCSIVVLKQVAEKRKWEFPGYSLVDEIFNIDRGDSFSPTRHDPKYKVPKEIYNEGAGYRIEIIKGNMWDEARARNAKNQTCEGGLFLFLDDNDLGTTFTDLFNHFSDHREEIPEGAVFRMIPAKWRCPDELGNYRQVYPDIIGTGKVKPTFKYAKYNIKVNENKSEEQKDQGETNSIVSPSSLSASN